MEKNKIKSKVVVEKPKVSFYFNSVFFNDSWENSSDKEITSISNKNKLFWS